LLLLEGDELHLRLHGRKRGGDASRARSHDHHVERPVGAALLRNRAHRLAPLLGGLADQADAAELAGDEEPFHVGLEVRLHVRDLDAAARRAEDEVDRLYRTRGYARAVADAGGRIDLMRLALHDAERLLRTRSHAGA